jgi:hypothetical protein
MALPIKMEGVVSVSVATSADDETSKVVAFASAACSASLTGRLM